MRPRHVIESSAALDERSASAEDDADRVDTNTAASENASSTAPTNRSSGCGRLVVIPASFLLETPYGYGPARGRVTRAAKRGRLSWRIVARARQPAAGCRPAAARGVRRARRPAG